MSSAEHVGGLHGYQLNPSLRSIPNIKFSYKEDIADIHVALDTDIQNLVAWPALGPGREERVGRTIQVHAITVGYYITLNSTDKRLARPVRLTIWGDEVNTEVTGPLSDYVGETSAFLFPRFNIKASVDDSKTDHVSTLYDKVHLMPIEAAIGTPPYPERVAMGYVNFDWRARPLEILFPSVHTDATVNFNLRIAAWMRYMPGGDDQGGSLHWASTIYYSEVGYNDMPDHIDRAPYTTMRA